MHPRTLTCLTALVFILPLAEASAQQWPTNALPPGLTDWWPGDGNCLDVVGTNHGAPVGAVSFGAGKVGPCFNFDGAAQYVRIPHSPSLNPTGSFTLHAWVFPTQTANQIILGKWGDAGDYDYQRSYVLALATGNAAQFAISDAAHQLDGAFHVFNTPANLVPLNAWTHVAGVYHQNTGTRRLYINGVLRAERTDPPITVVNGIAAVGVGAYLRSSALPAGFFKGRIDEVSFCNRALSSNEVAAVYAAGSAGQALPPVLSATPVSDGLLLSWFALYSGHGLIARPDAAAGSWEAVTNAAVVNGTRQEVLVPASGAVRRFFRLKSGD